MRQLILDTETTGLEVEKGHRIIEFAALEMVDRKLTGEYLHLYINPERDVDEGASRIHGITNDDLVGKPLFAEVVDSIVTYIKDAELVIHNAKFDLGFLNYQLNLVGSGRVDDYASSVIDTLLLARQKFPGSKNNLDALCDRFDVNREQRDYHGALIDCRLLADVYLALTREQVSLLGHENNDKSMLQDVVFDTLDTRGLNLKLVHPSDKEHDAHQEYLTTLDKVSHGKSAWFNKVT